MSKYVCPCGYVYDPEVGDPDNGIAPGTPGKRSLRIGSAGLRSGQGRVRSGMIPGGYSNKRAERKLRPLRLVQRPPATPGAFDYGVSHTWSSRSSGR
jgi:hypothetical protein